MIRIIFSAQFGDEIKKVEVSENFYGPTGFDIYVSGAYNGKVVKFKRGWVAHLNAKSELSFEDLQVIYDSLDAAGAGSED